MLTQKMIKKKQGGYCFGCSNPKPMPITKIRAFLEEFPWVRKFIDGQVSHVYVSVVEPSILNYFPHEINLEDLHLEQIYLLDREGEVIINETEMHRKKFLIFGPVVSKIKKICGIVERYSTIDSALISLGDKIDLVNFIFSYYEYTEAAIVYKLPKGVLMSKWIQDSVESERSAFQKV